VLQYFYLFHRMAQEGALGDLPKAPEPREPSIHSLNLPQALEVKFGLICSQSMAVVPAACSTRYTQRGTWGYPGGPTPGTP